MNSLLFTDPLFLFLVAPAILLAYFVTPSRWRNVTLFLASVLFYAWGEGRYTLVLLASLGLNYTCALGMGRAESPARMRSLLAAGVTANLLLLGVFKYAGFLVANVNLFLAAPWAVPDIHLPVGVSFFTFMGISYLVDVYRRDIPAEKSLTKFGLYLTLFPHLIAGPIVRYVSLAAELTSRRTSVERFAEGVRRFTIGLAKKVLIANTIAATADKVFALRPAELSTASAWLGAVCYTLQIYYDFSGYSDMAIGLAKMFGFTFPENFNYPYVSRSITEFWTRWHISLSSWLRDYLFFPLGVRRGKLGLYRNVMIVFLLCGLWHGAAWRFLVWGLFHGMLLVFERAGLAKGLKRMPVIVQHAYTVAAVMVGWVFFRADKLADGVTYLSAMAGLTERTSSTGAVSAYFTPDVTAALVVGAIGCIPVIPFLNRWIATSLDRLDHQFRPVLDGAIGAIRLATMGVLFVAASALSAAGTYNPFIYFRF